MFWFYFEVCMMFLWQLPQNIVALIMLPFLGKMKLVRYDLYAFVFECQKMKGGISLGNFIFLSPNLAQKESSILQSVATLCILYIANSASLAIEWISLLPIWCFCQDVG